MDEILDSKAGAPVKRASMRVKVPPVQLDGSAPKTMPTASPRGGVGSRFDKLKTFGRLSLGEALSLPKGRHGVEPTGRNEPMNHRGGGGEQGGWWAGEPSMSLERITPGSRASQFLAKAAELEPGSTVVGSDNGPAGSVARPPTGLPIPLRRLGGRHVGK